MFKILTTGCLYFCTNISFFFLFHCWHSTMMFNALSIPGFTLCLMISRKNDRFFCRSPVNIVILPFFLWKNSTTTFCAIWNNSIQFNFLYISCVEWINVDYSITIYIWYLFNVTVPKLRQVPNLYAFCIKSNGYLKGFLRD